MVYGTWFVLCMGIGITMGWYAHTHYSLAKRMSDTPTTPISNLTEGFVEVKGQVSALSEPLVSPMSGVSCVYYRFHVQEQVQQGKSTVWKTRIDKSEHKLCLIEDDSGAVELDLITADLRLAPHAHAKSGFMNNATPEMEELLYSYGLSTAGIIFNKTLKFEETVLEVGDQVYALGECVIREGSFPEITKGANGVYLVTDRSEESLTRSLRQKAAGFAIGATLVVVGGTIGAAYLASL